MVNKSDEIGKAVLAYCDINNLDKNKAETCVFLLKPNVARVVYYEEAFKQVTRVSYDESDCKREI